MYTQLTRACRMEELRRESCIRGTTCTKADGIQFLEKFCSVRGSPTTQRINTPSRVAPRFFVLPFSLITFSTSLFAKAMACDGRMDGSDPSNSSGTKNRHLNYGIEKFSYRKYFVVLNFRCRKFFVRLIFVCWPVRRRFFNNENFPIYGNINPMYTIPRDNCFMAAPPSRNVVNNNPRSAKPHAQLAVNMKQEKRLSLSLSRKNRAAATAVCSPREALELIPSITAYPCGIMNSGNSCYANSITYKQTHFQ